MSQFLVGAGVALLSAALGFTAASLQQRMEKRRRRRALAGTFLIDLRWLERTLRNLYKDEHAGNSIVPLKNTVFDRAGTDLLLFDVETVQALSHVYGLVSDLSTWFEEQERRGIRVDDVFHHRVRAIAGFAANAIGSAKAGLEKAGGSLPRAVQTEPKSYPELPRLNAASFD